MSKKIDTFRSGLVSDLVGIKREQHKKEDEDNFIVWTSENVKEATDLISRGGRHPFGTPYRDNIIGIRKPNIVFEWTQEEVEEWNKCANDIKYWAETHAQIKNQGVYSHFKLRDYQIELLDLLDKNRRVVIMASRQTGKTISTALTLLHYMIFNADQKALLLANKGDTVVEVMDKIQEIYERLPFWLQPGVEVYNQKSMAFDNGCSIVGLPTSKNMGIGFTADFIFIDEVAHIEPNLFEKIWSSIMPTLDANPKSKMVASSTPLGKNFFWKIWKGATDGTSGFVPFKSLWWQVPGRDESWKNKQILELGNGNYEEGLEIFTREYDCLFVTDSTLLMDVETLDKLNEKKENYTHLYIEELEDLGIDYSGLIWSDRFKTIMDDIRENNKSEDKLNLEDRYWIISIDLGKGLLGDYSVANIFEIEKMNAEEIKKVRNPKNEFQFLKYKQTGMYRSNKTDANIVAQIIMELVKFFGIDNTIINFEANRLGEYFYKCLQDDDEFFEDLVIHTQHNKTIRSLNPGVLITSANKVEYCKTMKKMIINGEIIINESDTIEELSSFGVNKKRTSYEAQSGNDDIVMSIVNLAPVSNTFTFEEFASTIIDSYEKELADLIYEQLSLSSEGTEIDYKNIGVRNESFIIPKGFEDALNRANSLKNW